MPHRWRSFTGAWRFLLLAFAFLLSFSCNLAAATPPARFPQPEFESGYVQPLTTIPPPRALAREYADVGVLLAALTLASWLALKRRSRAGIVALSLFTIAYFGFYRRGCVCPIGAIQNVTSALTDPSYVIPWTVAAFFLLPLIFAAFFGRVFCAAVCPLGALQDLVLWKSVPVPAWLSAPLRLLPAIYLGAAVLLAATGADYIVCRYDPFIGFYRLGGPVPMLLTGGALLLLGLFIGRPYCRFLCPYGVLLQWISRFAFRHATITPAGCINCRLCEQSCPFDCIRPPEPERLPEARALARRRLGRALALAPLLLLLGAGGGYLLHVPLARLHPEFRLAERVALEARGQVKTYTLESETFRATERSIAALNADAARIRRLFRAGSVILGGLIGLLLGARLIGLARWPRRPCHELDPAECLACARCFASCSVGRDAAKCEAEKT